MPVLFVKFNFCSTMKKLMILVSAIVLTASAATAAYVYSQKSSDLFDANVAALTSGESAPDGSVMDYVCKYIGCCGRNDKCFSGSVSIKGVEISGTFYMN